MPTLWTQTLIPTLRHAPADAEVPSHQLLLRAGYIKKLGSGSYSYLPLGMRSLHRVMNIIREEMAAAGAAEVFLPTLQPIDLWERTGRREAYGDNLFVVQDRHGRDVALGPTHEEVITDLVGSYIESYRDLPLTLYQIQTKFRDEFRPRFGPLRSREFLMKDAYSFHLTLEGEGGLDATYQRQYEAYGRIFTRCGVPFEIVEAESGPIGGSASHEFMVPSPTGEDTILQNDHGYAANVEKCEIGQRSVSETLRPFSRVACDALPSSPPTGELELVHTPDTPGIDDVIAFFKKELKTKLKPQNMLKALVCRDEDNTEYPWVVAVVRGDHDLNVAKLGHPLADEKQARDAGFPIGFVGPHIVTQRNDTRLLIDPDAAIDTFWVTGGNQPDHHAKHFHWQRDVLNSLPNADAERGSASEASGPPPRLEVRDLRNATAGDPAPESRGGGTLRETKGIEVGHVFKLGDKYTRALDVTVNDEHNQPRHPLMGCYGIGVNRILAAAIECPTGHDDAGIIWSAPLAPFDVLITPIRYEGELKEVTDRLAAELESPQAPHVNAGQRDSGTPAPDLHPGLGQTRSHGGLSVLIDDRDARPGVKFTDADLIGIPLRITVGDKGLKEGNIELKARDGSLGDRGQNVPLDTIVQRIHELLHTSTTTGDA